MRMALEKAGYQVSVVHNGRDALDTLLEKQPDVLITDIEMPVMSGRELCEAIETQIPDRTFPIYVCTSVTDMEHREWTKQINNLSFLEKPVSIKKLTSELAGRLSS